MPDTLETAAGVLSGRQAQIAEAARTLLDAEGPEALTMRRIVGLLGIKAPSLYKHGMVSLEIDGRFPPQADLDEAWRSGLAAFALLGQ